MQLTINTEGNRPSDGFAQMASYLITARCDHCREGVRRQRTALLANVLLLTDVHDRLPEATDPRNKRENKSPRDGYPFQICKG